MLKLAVERVMARGLCLGDAGDVEEAVGGEEGEGDEDVEVVVAVEVDVATVDGDSSGLCWEEGAWRVVSRCFPVFGDGGVGVGDEEDPAAGAGVVFVGAKDGVFFLANLIRKKKMKGEVHGSSKMRKKRRGHQESFTF